MALYRSEQDFLHSLKLFNTLSSAKYNWHSGKSSREHECEFGHVIPPEHIYFKKPLDSEGEKKIRVCKSCMEKLVHITVDSDAHSKELVENIFKQKNPKPKTLARKARA